MLGSCRDREGLAQLEWGEGRRAGAMCASASGLSSRLPWRSGPFLPWKTLVLEQKCWFLGRCVVLAPCILHPTMGCLFCPPLWAGGREATPSGKLILQDPKGTRGFQAWPWSWYLHEIPSSGETQAHHNPGERRHTTTLGNATKECCKCPPGCWVTRGRLPRRPPTWLRRAV